MSPIDKPGFLTRKTTDMTNRIFFPIPLVSKSEVEVGNVIIEYTPLPIKEFNSIHSFKL